MTDQTHPRAQAAGQILVALGKLVILVPVLVILLFIVYAVLR